jgi:segregation and condensation protein A
MNDAPEEKTATAHAQLFHLQDFEGPLDLLLFLIKKNEINIYDIPISSITEQYLEFLSWADSVGLESLTDFYALAATLLLIKSRMLLPVDVDMDDEVEDPRSELVEKLIEYQKIKKLSELMEEKELEAEWVLERRKQQRPLPFEDDGSLWDDLDVWDLLKTFTSLMSTMSAERIIDLYEEVSVNEKIALMEELLDDRDEILFTDLIVRKESLIDIVCAFLAILEAVKMRFVSIRQHRLFGDIQIRRWSRAHEAAEGESHGVQLG